MVIRQAGAREWKMPLLAAGSFSVLAALRFAIEGDGSDGIMFLSVLPIALLAASRGLRGGIAGAVVAFVLLVVWTVVEGIDLNAIGYLTRTASFLAAGGIIGSLADARSRVEDASNRWFEMSNDMLVEASLDGYFVRLSEGWERCLGWTREELMSRPFQEFVHPDDLPDTISVATALDRAPGQIADFENRYRTKDGSYRWLLWTVRSDEHRKYGAARDITDRKELAREREELLAQVESMARTDSLTGLPNRRSWDEEVQQALARARRHGRSLALAMIDLDHFKRFNDMYGHTAGDELLVEAAACWRLTLRETDFLARYGGEEFAVLLPGCAPDEALGLLERLRHSTPRQQTCSIGIANWDGIEGAQEFVSRADVALYDAKREGRDRVRLAA